MCDQCGHDHTEANARKLWRKHGFGRLYRRQNNRRWYKGWLDSKFDYYAKSGTGGMLMRDARAVIHTALGIDEE